MQTFVPYPSTIRSLAILDNRRLNKQITEARQILDTLTGVKKGWTNHPAVRMWRGHEEALALYGLQAVSEWRLRGYSSHIGQEAIFRTRFAGVPYESITQPAWWGDERVHRSHRANLLRKAPEHYGKYFLKDEPDLQPEDGYYWPVTS